MTRIIRYGYKYAKVDDQIMAMPPIGSSNYTFLTWCPKCRCIRLFTANGWDVSDKARHRYKWPEPQE